MFFLRKILFLFSFVALFQAFSVHPASVQEAFPELIYYDADSIKIKENLNIYELDGHAAFMMGNLFLTADKIVIEKEEKFVTAEGHVKIIYKKTQAIASKILYDGNTKQLRMDDAKIYSNPNSTEPTFEYEALGFSQAEFAFETQRKLRQEEIILEFRELRKDYANLKNLLSVKKDKVTANKLKQIESQYAELLAHYLRITSEPNGVFNQKLETEQTRYQERRLAYQKFTQEYPDIAERLLNFDQAPFYIYVSASQIIQKDNDTYLLNDTFITPCNCGNSIVPPIFGFSAKHAKLDIGNYVTMESSTLDMFRIPVFYLPWSKISIKSKRETGFLYPSGYLSNNAGFAVSFPFFLTLGEHADSTTLYEYFSSRGSRISENVRIGFWEGSTLYIGGNTAFDKLYSEQWAENKVNVDNAIAGTTDPLLIQQYKSFVGYDQKNRWYVESAWNIPLAESWSIKFNGQVVSDNTYLADYMPSTNIDPMSTVYGNTTPASRRFLNQEIDAEYYGNHVVFSARNTRYQDLFSLKQNQSPISLPLLEFTLLPGNYFEIPLSIANKTTFEDILDTHTVQGKRFASNTYFTLNLPRNNYLNSYLQLQETFVQYYSTSALAASFTSPNPSEVYSRFSFRTEVPFYTVSKFKNKKEDKEITVQNNFTPFVDASYIPVVSRSESFPYTYQLWYAADNVAKQALISVGTIWTLNIQKKSFKPEPIIASDIKIADLQILNEILTPLQPPDVQKNLDNMYILPTDPFLTTQVYTKWAQIELDRFYDEMLKSQFNQIDFVPNVQDNTEYNFTPVKLKIFSNYNIIASQTTNELNQIAGPQFSPFYLPEPFGDLSSELNWSLLPFVGWDGSMVYSYSFAYDRLNNFTTSTNLALIYGFAALARYQILYAVEPPAADFNPSLPDISPNFVRKTFINFGLTYTPKPFIKVGFEWAKNMDPTTAQNTALGQGRSYGSSIYVKFLNLQDCMDIIIARNKPAGYAENQATYSIGVNIKFFGHEMSFNQIGNWINSKLQK